MIALYILLFIINVILFEFFSFFFPELTTNVEFYSLLFVLIHGIGVLLCLIFKGGQYKHILVVAFLIRLCLMFADLYHWFPILHSGADSESFHYIAVLNQNISNKIYLSNYTNWLTLIYSFVNCSRMVAQYLNVLFGIGIIIILKQILELFELKVDTIIKSLMLVAFLPNLIIFSGILLREAWIEFFAILSVLYFLKWYKAGEQIYILYTILSVLCASYMHSGTIAILIGYIFAFLMFNSRTGTLQLSRTSILSFVVLCMGMPLLMGQSSLFLGKFGNVKSADILVTAVNYQTDSGSAYLTWIHADSLWMSLIFAPLKMFYFLFSPLPTNWRGLSDIVAFLIDSSFYLFTSWSVIKNNNQIKNSNYYFFYIFILIGLIIDIFVFAYGTYTAGTAMRHRAKIFPIMVVLFALSSETNAYKRL